ncbi:hypothetical protein LEN26_005783 [Aphanomyces euteiches]|nr:hypothetical protein AeMF1_000169 [Aphanomyces euteiches]KAH9137366.1 hypothetical protein LEN26_005783 [Aphanomyces euteiches]KAH9195743.1 hypothetical protein AeNC1_002284 [Aphanomyces euteiches]
MSGDDPKSDVEVSQNDWLAMQLPREILLDGGKLAHHFRNLALDHSDAEKRKVLAKFDQLKKEPFKEIPMGVFSGEDLDHMRLFNFSREDSAGLKKSFLTSTPSAVLRELELSQMSPSAIHHEMTMFQKNYIFQKHLELLARCVVPSSTHDEKDESEFIVTSHDAEIFPQKLFSLASTRLQLEMLSSFRQLNPTFYRNGMRVLIRSVLDCPPQALQLIRPKTAEAAILQSMFEFCSKVIEEASSDSSEKLAALSLLLALGESSGQAHLLLYVVDCLLLERVTSEFPDAAFEAEVKTILSRFETYQIHFDLGSLSSKVLKRFRIQEDDDSVCGALASCGKYLFAFTGQGLSKIGTGYQGTMMGNVYAKQPLSTFSEWVGWDLTSTKDKPYYVHVTHAQKTLYVWFVWKEADDKNSSLLLELSDSDLDMTSRDCDNVEITESIENASQVSICSDGAHIFIISISSSTLSWRQVDQHDYWKTLRTESIDLEAQSKDIQSLFKGATLPIFYTNGHVLIGTTKKGTQLLQIEIPLTYSNKSDVKYSANESEVEPHAINFDAYNNVLWSSTSKTILCHVNTGKRILPRAKKPLHEQVQFLVNSPLNGQVTALRVLKNLQIIVDSYLPDDINQMDVEAKVDNIPFGVDIHPFTFKNLTSIIAKFSIVTRPLEEWESFVLIVSIKMLSLNTLYWLAKKKQTIADIIVKSDLPSALQPLFSLNDNPGVAKAAQMLYVLLLDIFYPKVSSQWELLASYLEQSHTSALHADKVAIVELLLDRFSSKQKMQDLIEEAKSGHFEGIVWFKKLLALSINNTTIQQHRKNDIDENIQLKLTHLMHTIVQGVVGGYRAKLLSKETLIHFIRLVIDSCIELCEFEDVKDVQILESSVLNEVISPLFGYFQSFLADDGDCKELVDFSLLKDISQLAMTLLQKLNHLIEFVPLEEREKSIDVHYIGKSTVTMESAHDYSNDMHEIKELRLDGATSITITFDERTRTEQNYDYITFYHDKSCSAYYGEEKYSGRDSSFNWPGVGNIPPLVIDSDHCFVLFHTDGSTVDWGYKFTAVANVSENNVSLQLHWLTAIQEQVMNWLTTIVSLSPTWTSLDGIETDQVRYLESDLLHGGIDTKDPNDVLLFLNDLIELSSPDTPAAHVAKILKKHTIQDQGSIPHVNRAVRAVAAAILHHNMWGMDAYALGQGLRNDPSMSLLKTWKNAQKMRNWFDIGDAKRTVDKTEDSAPKKPKLSRQPSAYSGASEDALRTLCTNVEERAKFLLSLAPASFSLATASEDPTGAKKRWSLLAQYGTALSKGDNPASIIEKWHSLVDEVECVTELKRMLLYRKHSAGRHQGKHAKSVTEMVLEFVQSDVVVSDVAAGVAMRNRRAHFRWLSLTILHETLKISQNSRLQHNLLERFWKSISDLDPNKVHLLTHTHGCSLSLRNSMRELFGHCLGEFTSILRSPKSDLTLQTSVLKCLSMDYDLKDGDLVFKSDIIPAVFNSLTSTHLDVRKSAQATARVLLERFMVRERETNVQKQLCTAVVHYLDRVHQPVGGGLFLPLESRFLCSEKEFSALGLWVYLPEIRWRQLRKGDEVCPGPQWKESARSTGVVIGVHGNDISVSWSPVGIEKAHKGFHKYDVSKNVLEIIPVDQDPSGQIVLRKNHNQALWGEVGLRLTTDLCIEASVSTSSSQTTTVKSVKPLQIDQWQFVSFGRENGSLRLIIEGETVAEESLSESLKLTGNSQVTHVIDTPHPYHGQAEQWSTFPVSIPGATLVRISFDQQSNLTHASNYIAFYSDESMECVYGENMYNQAFGNFPGVADNPMLEIPSGNFVVGLFTEDSSELWGFRIEVHVVENSDSAHETNTLSQVYLGETPLGIGDKKAATCYVEDFKLMDELLHERPQTAPSTIRYTSNIDMAINSLSFVEMCLSSQNEFGAQIMSSSESLHQVLHLSFSSDLPAIVRCAASCVLSHVLTTSQLDIEDGENYVSLSLDFLSKALNIWKVDESTSPQLCATTSMWLVSTYATFLRACCNQIDLGTIVVSAILRYLNEATTHDTILAALAVLGGVYEGVFIGSRVKCLMRKDAVEIGSIVGLRFVGDQRYARVLMDLDMTHVVQVPLAKIDVEDQRPAYLSALYDRVSPHLTCLVDVMQTLEAHRTLPLLDVQARLLKAIHLLCQHHPNSSVVTLLRPHVMELALVHHDGDLLGIKPSFHDYESRHPYTESLDVYETISIKNAKALKITFDARSRTEHECDYLIFYKDESHSEFWGEARYSGRDGSENFPGLNGRSALEIPSDRFVLYWHTDSSNNDWGYKFTVEATYNDIAPSSFSLNELNQRMYHLSESLYEQRKTLTIQPVRAEPERSLKRAWTINAKEDNTLVYLSSTLPNSWSVAVDELTMYEHSDTSSNVLTKLSRDTSVEILEDIGNWVYLKSDERSGWCEVVQLQSLERKLIHQRPDTSSQIAGWESAYVTLPLPEDLLSDESNRTENFESHFNQDTINFTTPTTTTFSLIQDFTQCLTIQYSKLCLRSYISSGLQDETLSVETFLLLAQLFVLEKDSVSEMLANRLKFLVSQGSFAEDVLSLCVSNVSQKVQAFSSNRIDMRYIDDMDRDSFVTINFPGCSSIRIVFDSKTHCHESDEYVQIFDKEGPVGTKYQGAKGDCWPGAGKEPPLVVNSDTVTVQFQYVQDTGASRLIKFTAFGLYSDDNSDSSVPSVDDIRSNRLACWVFSIVAKTQALPGSFVPRLLDVLCQLYQIMPQEVQLDVIDVWSALLTNQTIFDSLLPSQIHAWMNYVKNKLWLQHASEFRTKSAHLQRLLQVVVDMDIKFESYCLQIESASDTLTNFVWFDANDQSTCTLKDNDSVVTSNSRDHHIIRATDAITSGRHAWNIHVMDISSSIEVGITVNCTDMKYTWPKYSIIKKDDILGFEIDVNLSTLTFKRNSAIVSTVNIKKHECFYPAVILGSEGDQVAIRKQPPLLSLRRLNSNFPPWYKKIISTVRLLRGLTSIDSMSDVNISQDSSNTVFAGAKQLQIYLDPKSKLDPRKYLELSIHDDITEIEWANYLQRPLPYIHQKNAKEELILKRVVRGCDWKYSNDDGMPGNIGIILSQECWEGVALSAVRVQWLHNNKTGIYRYGYKGLYDVEVLYEIEMPTDSLALKGEMLKIMTKSKSDSTSLFNGALNFDGTQSLLISDLPSLHGDFTIQLWVRFEKFDSSCIFQVTNSGLAWWMSLSVSANRQLNFTLFHSNEETMSTAFDIDVRIWTQIELCICGSFVAIHTDGKLVSHQRFSTKHLLEKPSSSSIHFGSHNSKKFQPLVGQMFGVKLWNAPLHLSEYSEMFVNDERFLAEECPKFDDLANQCYPNDHEEKLIEDIPKSIVHMSEIYSAMTFNSNCMHFASIRPKQLGVLSPMIHTKVYYEVTLFKAMCVQIGWSFKDCTPKDETSGIGDCKLSYGINLVAQAKWHGEHEPISEVPWQAGDVVGCLLDWDSGEMSFSVNGRILDNVKFSRGDSNGSSPHELNSPTPSMLAGLWGDEDDDGEANIGDEQLDDVGEEGRHDDTPSNSTSGNNSPDNFPVRLGAGESFEVEQEPGADITQVEDTKKSKIELKVPLKNNSWLLHSGIFPSLSLRTGDSIRWNFGHTPLVHCPEGYMPIAQAVQILNEPVVFEKFDFEDKEWHEVSFRHRVNNVRPALIGEWMCQDGNGNTVKDTSGNHQHGTLQHSSESSWNSNVLSPPISFGTGFALRVHPIYLNARSLLSLPTLFQPDYMIGRQKEYLEMVRYVNKVSTTRNLSLKDLLSSTWATLAPEKEELIRWPCLAELVERNEDLSYRFNLLVHFNNTVRETLEYVELTSSTNLAKLLSSARGLIFGSVKHELWDPLLEKTQAGSSPEMSLTLNRPKAARWKPTNNDYNRFALFAQAYREMINWAPSIYCRTNNLYVVTFLGENSIDAGGPYRETLSQFCAELQSSQLPLLLPTPNGQHNVGTHRDAWVLHPVSHEQHSGMLIFLGKLLGVAIRTKYCLSLNLSQVVWKLLVQDPITLDDLEAIDTLVVSSMRSLRTIEQSGVTEELFADFVLETMTTLSTDNRMVNLVDDGDSIPVTFATRHTFADLVEAYRMHEFDDAAKYLRQGLGLVVPLRLLRLFTWMELEALVCGTPEVDIDLLEKCTEYSSCNPTDQHVIWFWEVLRGYNQEARQAFLRFVWGRSRLPRSIQEFQNGQQFKLQGFGRQPADMYMPVSHTCFFSLELPRYSSLEVLSTRLTYAIFNCVAIDGDTNTMQANQLGWED